VSRYTTTTADDLREMLAAIGVGSVDELFAAIPPAVRLGRALDLPAGMPEQDVYAHLLELARRNVSAEDEITFLGAGMYDHYVPAVIDMLMGRSEFLTPYTPYQPEMSQGGLQVMLEYHPPAGGIGGYTVQVAAYDTRAAAEALIERLKTRGYTARLASTTRPFRVRIGRYDTRADAIAAQQRLKAKGLDGFVTEMEKP
jgi:glycine dehydrogenase subunit 1